MTQTCQFSGEIFRMNIYGKWKKRKEENILNMSEGPHVKPPVPPAEKAGGMRIKGHKRRSKEPDDEDTTNNPSGIAGSIASSAHVEIEDDGQEVEDKKEKRDARANPAQYHPPPQQHTSHQPPRNINQPRK